jgi:hypothetical protein
MNCGCGDGGGKKTTNWDRAWADEERRMNGDDDHDGGGDARGDGDHGGHQ